MKYRICQSECEVDFVFLFQKEDAANDSDSDRDKKVGHL